VPIWSATSCRHHRTWPWSVAAWLGSSTAFAGLTGVLLEPRITGPLALVCVVEALVGLALGVAALLSVAPTAVPAVPAVPVP
jgi:hypothetical protein